MTQFSPLTPRCIRTVAMFNSDRSNHHHHLERSLTKPIDLRICGYMLGGTKAFKRRARRISYATISGTVLSRSREIT